MILIESVGGEKIHNENLLNNINEKRIASFIKILEETKEVEFPYNEFYYEIFESADDERDEYGDYLDKYLVDGGLAVEKL